MAYWGNHPVWQKLGPTQKAAAMALLEADLQGGKINLEAAKNALGAMINRADKVGQDLGEHVSGKAYQPTIEDAQFQRLPRIIASPEFQQMTALAEARLAGAVPDWVKGATHFLAPEKTMLALEAEEPGKYKNWGPRGLNWTGYGKDPSRPNEYAGVVFRDGSHAFLAPEGAHSANFGGAGGNPIVARSAIPTPPDPGVTEVPKTQVAAAGSETSGPFTVSDSVPREAGSMSSSILAGIAKALEGEGQQSEDALAEKLKEMMSAESPFAKPPPGGGGLLRNGQLLAELVARQKAGKLGA